MQVSGDQVVNASGVHWTAPSHRREHEPPPQERLLWITAHREVAASPKEAEHSDPEYKMYFHY